MAAARNLAELAALFLRLGVTAFGGPAAHVAMMRAEVVGRRRWLTDAELLDLIAATHLLPGPNSTELAIHLGWRRGRLRGLAIAGVCFILPAAVMVGAIAYAYVRFGGAPQAAWLMYGVGPVIIGVIAHAVWKLGRAAAAGALPFAIAAATALLSAAGVDELALLAGGALAAGGAHLARGGAAAAGVAAAGIAAASMTALLAKAAAGSAATAAAAAVPVTLTRLTLFFLKVGSVLFGSGYVLIAFLRADLTERWGWLTEQELIDAVTVGQVTPGPVFTTATFIGYLLHGWTGAVLATVGIFGPGFLFVLATQPLIPKLRASRAASRVLDGIVAASLGLMAAAAWRLGPAAIVDLPTAAVAAASAAALARWSLNTTWLIAGGAAVGWIARSVG